MLGRWLACIIGLRNVSAALVFALDFLFSADSRLELLFLVTWRQSSSLGYLCYFEGTMTDDEARIELGVLYYFWLVINYASCFFLDPRFLRDYNLNFFDYFGLIIKFSSSCFIESVGLRTMWVF